MSAEIIVKMNKSSRPPPPVPPRPSKSLIKEALAKTRQAHGNYVVSVTKPQAPTPPIQPPKEFQNKRLIIDNTRPVIYQSENCKSRSICSDITNKSEINNVLKKFEDNLRKSDVEKVSVAETKDELKQIESDNDEIKSVNETENQSALWECGFNGNNVAEITKSENDEVSSSTSSSNDSVNNCYREKAWNGTLNRNHVNTLIDEMFASVLEVNLSNNSSSTESITNKNTTVIVINNNEQTLDKKVQFNDRQNHEFLINELQNMKNDEKILKRQRRSPLNHFEDDADRIQKNDWYGLNEGKKVRMSSCSIKIEDEDNDKYQKMKNLSSSYGLPPLPSSLSGFKFIMDTSDPIKTIEKPPEVVDENSTDGQIMNLEKQLSILRREMDSLREQDLSLLSKLWFLNESIQDFRQMLQDQDQDDKVLTMCPSPTPSSIEDEDFYVISTSTC
ncbi:unnamed protein product [Ceutorhynchus assimilis]|uniref:Uncharacterized protein n=1 Tax=Ceutorhynchus assimilis TaxID=467358 RepID=A0A9N9QIU8_9CUCU|nr:unnamed protein product [Ceutorhynchus assimilis]